LGILSLLLSVHHCDRFVMSSCADVCCRCWVQHTSLAVKISNEFLKIFQTMND